MDGELTIIADPLIDDNFSLTDESPAIDAGVAQFSVNGVVVLNIPSSQYFGNRPDLGAVELNIKNSDI